MKLSISIMAHPKRAHLIPALSAQLGNPPVAMDDGCGLIVNSQRAWALHDPTADWHVVIQDDAVLTSGFTVKALPVLEQAEAEGCSCVNFHYGSMNHPELGETCVIKRSLYWGVAVCLPVPLIKPMIEYVKGIWLNPHDDGRISTFLKSRGLTVYYPIPSLVEHGDTPSLIGGRAGRKAFKFEP